MDVKNVRVNQDQKDRDDPEKSFFPWTNEACFDEMLKVNKLIMEVSKHDCYHIAHAELSLVRRLLFLPILNIIITFDREPTRSSKKNTCSSAYSSSYSQLLSSSLWINPGVTSAAPTQ